MSKASQLGMGSSFRQAQSISPRRAAIDAATSAPTEGALPAVKLPVALISLNPLNPRSSLGDLSDLAKSLRDHGQKTAISIMSRLAYLEANPELAEDLEPGTKYVAIDGNSRLAAAREGGFDEIKVMLDEELGSNPDEILESALVANVHRQDLDPLDEARALQQLLAVHGTQEALAARLHRSQGWISQRLALLGLTPELKQKLQAGQESAALLRQVGRKKPEEQAQQLQVLKEQQAKKKVVRQADPPTQPKSARPPADSAPPAPVNRAPAVTSTEPVVEAPSPVDSGRALGRYLQLIDSPEAFVSDLVKSCTPEYRQRLAELLMDDL
ncbi:ParB/RepB/Spo0J family partition protein [Streptomyces sp. NRRL S-241]|uniref:ParB/RepB/Spo0J family partition protein n=1 Tax=Streptomyces sp. NRRL S-241 TaxID=1463896 RepID=UPI0004C2955C|nr:ParB/RepB/Spo0J family partition protein [Streptomyces sp. NRRL S-241]